MTKPLGRRLFGLAVPGRYSAVRGHVPSGAPTAADCLRLYEECGAGQDGELAAAAVAVREAPRGGGGELNDALLGLGGVALDRGLTPLARASADAVLARRKGSRAAWQLRARALEAAGDLPGAVEAYERYLETGPAAHGAAEATARIEVLRADHAWRQDVLAALPDEPAVPELDSLATADFEAALETHLDARLAAAGPEETARLAPAVALLADRRRHRLRPPLDDPLFGGTTPLRIGEFRTLIAGRSACLVANSRTVQGGSLGAAIDAYDLVVRFTSYRIDPSATGTRTDVHATATSGAHNWRERVTTRLVFCDRQAQWRQAMRGQLVSGAQDFTGDESLRRPLRGVGGLSSARWPAALSCGFEMVWLLDFLDVSARIDLVGFDFFTTEPFRLPEASGVAVPSDYSAEKAWVMERAQHVKGPVISLR